MFEQALILRAGVGTFVDLGLLAETLFFYGSTQLVLDRPSVISLAQGLSSNDLLALLSLDEVKVSYVREQFAVHSSGVPVAHDFGAVQLHASEEGRRIKNHRDEIVLMLERALGTSPDTSKLAHAVADRTKLHRFAGTPEKSKIVPDLARKDVQDATFVREAVTTVLRHLVPDYPLPVQFRFELLHMDGNMVVDTDLDFDAINRIYHQAVSPTHSTITPAYLLSHIVTARADTYFAAYYMAELVTPPVYSDIIRLKHFDFLRRRDANANEIEQFRELIVPDFPTIREAINSGERTFSEFLSLLDKASKFKSWLRDNNPDAGLVQEYYRKSMESTWADKLPTKGTRFVVATGLGIIADMFAPTGIGTGLGIAAGATDTFILDRLIKGWRPNQFIEGPYRDFVGS